MSADERTPQDRELDNLLDSLSGFHSLGLRSEDYPDWADGGIEEVREGRISNSGVAGLEGERLAKALQELAAGELARALGISKETEELDPKVGFEAGPYRRELTGSNVRAWSRLLFCPEREVFVALAPDGVQAARLRVEWEGQTPVSVIRPLAWAPWNLRRIHRAIDEEARGRRASYAYCVRCRRPTPPEHREPEADGEVCHSCLEESGVAF